MSQNEVKIHDSWIIANLGLVVELSVSGSGVPSGTKLISESGVKWTVNSRVLYKNALDIHKRYAGEKETLVLLPGSKQGVALQESNLYFTIYSIRMTWRQSLRQVKLLR